VTYIVCYIAFIICAGIFYCYIEHPFHPSRSDFIAWSISAPLIAGIEILFGYADARVGFPLLALMIFVGAVIIHYASSSLAWLFGEILVVIRKFRHRCPQCDSKEVINEEFTDIFDYVCAPGIVSRLSAKSVKHICCNCGFEFTGYQNENDRAKAVKNYLTR